jgi:hypothetical protein
MWRPLVRTLLLLVSPGLVSPGLAETRVALVVGNSDYRSVSPLPNPANDARLIAQTLSSRGDRRARPSDQAGGLPDRRRVVLPAGRRHRHHEHAWLCRRDRSQPRRLRLLALE